MARFHFYALEGLAFIFLFTIFYLLLSSPRVALATESPTSTAVQIERPLRILIEPGHEPNFGGTAFRKLIERDLTVALGAELQQLLAEDPHFQVMMTRDTRDWNPIFSDYFRKNWNAIIAWKNSARKNFNNLIAKGKIRKPVSKVSHNKAPSKVATRLYGMNRWANENNFDVTLNIHFDDENGHRRNVPGRFSGFTIYQHSPQYNNSERSRKLARALLAKLEEVSQPSNLAGHKGGIIDEPMLIAIGENNTSNATSLVIEYGFIYEKKFTDPKLRSKTLEDLARATYQALEDYRTQLQ